MIKALIHRIKGNPKGAVLSGLTVLLFVLFLSLFNLSIIMSDDYYYSAFFKDGLLNFIKLTIEHFKTINGRALVHFTLHTVLAMPVFLRALINTLILTLAGVLSYRITGSKGNLSVHMIIFYSLILLLGKNVLTEGFIWTSGFYNYLFPAILSFSALFLLDKKSQWCALLSFLAGATTEQWGAATTLMLAISAYLTYKNEHTARKSGSCRSLFAYLPATCAICGYGTIFLSPATLNRIANSAESEFSYSLIDLPYLSEAFFTEGAPVLPISVFLLTMILYGYKRKGLFSLLISGALPLLLILLIPLHESYLSAFILLISFIALSFVVFFVRKNVHCSALLSGALTAMLIMLPTNTFDARITLPSSFMLLVISLTILSSLKLNFKAIVLIPIISSIMLVPTYSAFYKNYLVEKSNLNAIKEAQITKVLNYSIDYNKSYTMRQMFNDGWFFTSFVSLYDLEDCEIYLTSKNSEPIVFNGKKFPFNAIIKDNISYIPMRAFLNEAGGTIIDTDGVTLTLNGKSLVYRDGIFSYTDKNGSEKYLVADDNKLYDFYTLYIRKDVVENAFHIKITEHI